MQMRKSLALTAIVPAFCASAEIIVPESPVNELTGRTLQVEATNLHEGNGMSLFDGNIGTRWIVKPKPDPGTGVIPTVVVSVPGGGIAVNAYRLCGHTGENTMARHPKWFRLSASNDGETWTLLDERTSETGWAKGEQRLYEVDNATAYSSFKFEIYANNGDSTYTTLGELELFHFEQTDVLEIGSTGALIGSPVPAYGGRKGLEVGDKVVVDCPETRVNDVDTGDYYTLQGFTIVDYAGNVLKEGTAADLPYEYEHVGYAKLQWSWSSHLEELLTRSLTDITSPLTAGVNEITGESFEESPKFLFDNNFSNRWRANPLQKTGNHNWVQYRFLDGPRIVTAFQLFDSGSYPVPARFPCDFVFQGSNDGVNFADLFSISGAGVSKPHPKGTVYSFPNATPYEYYRLYMTKESATDWLQLGEMEFYSVNRPDTLRVIGAPKCFGHPMPDYGVQENLVGGNTYSLTGPAGEITVSDSRKSVCVGYKLRLNAGAESPLVRSSTFDYTHVAGDMAILVWQFDDTYRQQFVARGGGNVDVAETWSALGETVTVTATVGPNGAPFAGWSGDVPDGVDPSQPTISYPCDGSRTLVANFSPPLFVAATGSDENDGTSWDQAFATLTRAFASLPANGSLAVGPGTFTVKGGTLVLPPDATMTAPAGPAETAIEAEADSVGCLLAAGAGEIAGFTFRGGMADDGDAAGLRLDGTVVSNCVVESCVATAAGASGGGVAMSGGAQFLDSIVTNCTSAGNGGGLVLRGGVVKGCTIAGNTAAKSGGGFVVGGTEPVAMSDCMIVGNVAKTAYADLNAAGGGLVQRSVTLERLTVRDNRGGGLFLVRDVVLRDSTISGNSAVRGAGIYAQHAFVERCVVTNNTSSGLGGGLFHENGALRNSLVVGNSSTSASGGGGGLFCRRDLKVENCTITGNDAYCGAGVYSAGPFSLYNSIVAGNRMRLAGAAVTNLTNHSIQDLSDQYAQIRNSCIDDDVPNGFPAYASNGSIVADPQLVDAANGDCHLRIGSPCVNGGSMLDYTSEDVDLDGNARVFDFGRKSGRPDMGCYESPYGSPGILILVQ